MAQHSAGRAGLGSGDCPRRGGRASRHVRRRARRRHARHRGGHCQRNPGTSTSQLFAEFAVRTKQPRGTAGACPIPRSANAVARPGRRAAGSDASSEAAGPERAPAVAIPVADADADTVAEAQAVAVPDGDNHAAASDVAVAHANSHTDTHADADPHANTDADSHPHANTDAHRHANPHAAASSVSRPQVTQPGG